MTATAHYLTTRRYQVIRGNWKLALLAALIVSGCQQAPQRDLTREEAIELARGPADRIPGNDLSITHPVVHDGGTIWIVRFEPPAGASGGAVQVEIDKRTREVLSAMAEQ